MSNSARGRSTRKSATKSQVRDELRVSQFQEFLEYFQNPIGWDGKNFRETFPTRDLPFLSTETIDWGRQVKKIENRLIWGDNLSVMRSLPDECIDLIYIDPPFFSGRNYNLIFGDDDEVRTFSDIWDGGLPTYLAWLNARLWEMKRLLKPTGSLFIHLDWHAVYYAKVELDKIFGAEKFRNDLIWHYFMGGKPKRFFARKHDNILWYSKSDTWTFNYMKYMRPLPKKPSMGSHKQMIEKDGIWYSEVGMDDVWDISGVFNMAKEYIGYPTQKPEALLERIIRCASQRGDVVADFFCGGGTTATVSEKLDRRWIGCDISRIAIAVARDRLLSVYASKAGIEPTQKNPKFGFTIENQGAYERSVVRQMLESDYIKFVLQCYETSPKKKGDLIHAFKNKKAIHVAKPKGKVSIDLVEEFYAELEHFKINDGIILAWSWDKECERYLKEAKAGGYGPNIQLIQVKLVDIDSHEFKGENIRFFNKPAAVIRPKKVSGLRWVFDGTASEGRNGTEIHYYQWDLNYNGRFKPSTKLSFKDKDGDKNPLNDLRRIEYTFPEHGIYKIGLKIIDKSGAEATEIIELNTKQKEQAA